LQAYTREEENGAQNSDDDQFFNLFGVVDDHDGRIDEANNSNNGEECAEYFGYIHDRKLMKFYVLTIGISPRFIPSIISSVVLNSANSSFRLAKVTRYTVVASMIKPSASAWSKAAVASLTRVQ